MGQVTLRDLSTNEDIVVPPEGYIFGRVGGDADIQIEDNSISRRQARVSLKGGMWLLETLAVPAGSKPPRPVQLQEGASFTVGQSEFEVVQIEAQDDAPAAPTMAVQPAAKGKPAPAPAKKPNAPPNAKTTPSQAQKRPAADAAGGEAAPAAGAGGVKALFVGVPKGIAYYLLNVPKLLVNPIGTVRKTIEELPAEPMGKTELIGFALPSLFISALLPAFATGLGALIGPGHVFLLSSFLPIGPAIGAVIGAVVIGFRFHPVVEWVIRKLKGTSDARSRSNYFLQTMTLAIILAVPQALGIILAMVPIPFISLLGPLLMLVGTLVSFYVTYQWLVKFAVVKWMFTVMKVFAALAVLGAGWGLISGIIGTVRGLGHGGSSASAAAAEGAGESELGEMPTDPAEAAEWSKKKSAELMAKAAEAQKKAMAGVEDARDKANDAKDQAADAKDKGEDAPPAKTTKKDPPPKPETKPEPVAAKEPPTAKDNPPAVKDEPAAPASSGGGYGAFARRRDAIEKMFENDPTVLQKSADLQKLYADYIEDAYDLDKKWGKETSKKPERAKLNARLRDAELYGKSGKTIESIAGKLGIK